LVAAAKLSVAATKKIFVVPNFDAVTKPFFSVGLGEAYARDERIVSITTLDSKVQVSCTSCVLPWFHRS